MPSSITWLDISVDEQRRMRELASMFELRDSRDELGLGLLRDAIGDALFPGTSTLHTRARYLLFVPWCFQHAARSKPDQRWRRLDEVERAIISPLRSSQDSTGLLGERAGAALKNLPSSVYWSMLHRYGILTHPASRVEALDASTTTRSVDDDGHTTETTIWSVPRKPDGFPETIPDGFALTRDEAGWLRDRILEHANGSLLAHLMLHAPDPATTAPWHDDAALSAPDRARAVLTQGEDFSAVMHGAQLVYNYLLAVDAARYASREDSLVDQYRERLEDWAKGLTPRAREWKLASLLDVLRAERTAPAVIPPATLQFITSWSALVRDVDPRSIVDDTGAQALIRHREKIAKRAKARLGNPRRLETWGGASGSSRLTFRWATVQGIVADIHEGLERA